MDFSLKQGEKIKVNIDKGDKAEKPPNTFDVKNDAFWNFPGGSEQPKTVQSAIVTGGTASDNTGNSNPF